VSLATVLLLGVFTGGFAWFLARRLQCRSLPAILVVSVLGACTAYAATWYEAYRQVRGGTLRWQESKEDYDRRVAKHLLEWSLDRARDRKRYSEELRRGLEEVKRGGEPEMPHVDLTVELAPPQQPPAWRSESVQVADFATYFDFRLRRGWPERGRDLDAPFVVLIGLMELGVILGLGVWIPRELSFGTPFCERDGRWMPIRALGQLPQVDRTALEQAVRRGDLTGVLDPARESEGVWALYSVCECPDCRAAYLRVVRCPRDGKLQRTRTVVSATPVEQDQIDALKERLESDPLA
jgi:hypothetical protein